MPASLIPASMVYTVGMPDALTARVAQIVEQFRRDLAVLEEKHDREIREAIEKIRERRLAELRKDMTPRQ